MGDLVELFEELADPLGEGRLFLDVADFSREEILDRVDRELPIELECERRLQVVREDVQVARDLDGVDGEPGSHVGVAVVRHYARNGRSATLDELDESRLHRCDVERFDFCGHFWYLISDR